MGVFYGSICVWVVFVNEIAIFTIIILLCAWILNFNLPCSDLVVKCQITSVLPEHFLFLPVLF